MDEKIWTIVDNLFSKIEEVAHLRRFPATPIRCLDGRYTMIKSKPSIPTRKYIILVRTDPEVRRADLSAVTDDVASILTKR